MAKGNNKPKEEKVVVIEQESKLARAKTIGPEVKDAQEIKE